MYLIFISNIMTCQNGQSY